MIKLTAKQTQQIKEHTLACYPEEMCGLLVEGEFTPLKNVAENPKKEFRILEQDLIPYLGNITAIVHSHCYNSKHPNLLDVRTPSVQDVKQQKISKIPWLIVGTEGQNVLEAIQLPRTKNNTYLGRPFIWYINDCYTLVQDYYWFELGIDLPDAVDNKDYKSTRILNEPFKAYIKEYGFSESTCIDDMQNGDLILVDSGIASQNHLGIYHEGFILSQETLSIKQPFYNFIGRIHKVLRYVNITQE